MQHFLACTAQISRFVQRATLAVVFGICQLAAGSVVAQSLPEEAIVQPSARLPEASLSASANAYVDQDSVRISLTAQVSDKAREKVSEVLDKALDSVLKQAKSDGRAKVSSGNYHVWPIHSEGGLITGWQGRADVILESTDVKGAAALAGQLADRVAVSNVYFFVSKRARQAAEASLLEQAAQAFSARAAAVAKAFGYQKFEIKALSLDEGGAAHSPMPRLLAASGPQKSEVPLEPGQENVTVVVRGSVYLLP